MKKIKLLLFICGLSQVALSQVMVQTFGGPQVITTSQAVVVGANGALAYVTVNNYLPNLNGQMQDLNKRSGEQEKYLDYTVINRAISSKEKYSYEEFLSGHLIYASGNQSRKVKLNYNQFLGEMQFVDDNKDTLLVANADSISFVRLEDDLYRHDFKKGYFRVLSGTGQVSLTSKLQVVKIRQKDANRYSVLSKKTLYFLIGQNKNIYKANTAGFQKAFPKHKQQIKTYMWQMTRQGQSIKFSNEEDLVKLMKFCESLSKQS